MVRQVSSRTVDGYSSLVASVSESASEAAMRAYDEIRRNDVNASIADVREGIKSIVEQCLASYGDASAEVGASMYSTLADNAGVTVPEPELPEPDDEAYRTIDSDARWMVGLFGFGDREDI